MRLVEILARELGEWPEGAAVAVQDLDEGVYFNESARSIEYESDEMGEWSEVNGRSGWIGAWVTASVLATDHATAIVTREMWEAERAKLASTAEWNGEGLPPVGTVCEYHSKDNEWLVCEVVAHRNNAAVVLDAHYQAELVTRQDFRLCRTTEQIAAQERERAMDEIYRIIRTVERPGNKADMAEALYDAGYRKQEQQK